MQPAVLRALEFDRIREALAHEALTLLGRERADRLEPSPDPADVARRLELTTAAAAYVRAGGALAISAPEDLGEILEGLEVGQQPLEPLQLLGLVRFVESVAAVADGLKRNGGRLVATSDLRSLRHIAERVASFDDEVRAVRRAIHSSGEVNDDASPALRELRATLRRERGKLRSVLDKLTRGRDTAKYLQDQIVTDRNGRYVVVLRAEHRDAIPGIVHGSSTSGASLYLEPLPTVELNNGIVALAEREREEVRRILLALTDAFRSRREEFDATRDAAADLDELYAKAQLARRVDGAAPDIATDGRVEFRGARHPLLIPAVREITPGLISSESGDGAPGPAVVTATDLLVAPPVRALVISGPNTGGKTVALKAVGLLALMAQAGLLIPVDSGSQFTPFRSIFADIGDEQSIAASLSTFSARVANLVAMDRALTLPALVLLDEVGGGTDPAEGGALGIAVIDHFRQRGATVIATTHDDGIKSYAATTDGVATAAFGFDPHTYAPSYKLLYGAPGRSLALEIAERLGMPASVIAAARARRSTREAQLAEHLARVDKELAAIDADRRQLADHRQSLALERQTLLGRESKLAEREAVLKRRMDDKLTERLREARQEVDKIVADLKGKAGSLVKQAERRAKVELSTGDIGGLRVEAQSALESVAGRLDGTDTTTDELQQLDAPPSVGQTVFVAPFSTEGLVRAVLGSQVEVEVRGKRMRVPLSGLRLAARGSGRRSDGPLPSSKPQAASPRGAGLTASAARELVLIGSTIDQAVDRAEKFLDAALLADEHRLRVVHGHGTGRLRDGLRQFFRQHPLVATVTPAADNEGGDGATIVELKD
jgi:DNA mismatch repair protein MutS2